MSVSFNARHIVIFTDAGYLWLGSSNFRTKYCEVQVNYVHRPKQLIWSVFSIIFQTHFHDKFKLFRCGTEAIVAYWDNYSALTVVSRSGNVFTYSYDTPVFLVPEIDGVRIFSATQHELLQKVPDVVQKIFRINSTEPGSFLLEASKQFQVGLL